MVQNNYQRLLHSTVPTVTRNDVFIHHPYPTLESILMDSEKRKLTATEDDFD